MGSKTATLSDGNVYFHCPGCESGHAIDPARWSYDGNAESPTISPSILARWHEGGAERRCHSFVRAGRIEFLGDCTHALAGQAVDLPDVDDDAQPAG